MSDNLKVQGTIVHILDIQSGTSKAGKSWQKQDFVIETDGQFAKKIAFTLFGEKIKALDGIGQGSTVDVSFNLESREHEGRWFSNINAWKIDAIGSVTQAAEYSGAKVEGETTPPTDGSTTGGAPTDPLPF